MGLRRPSQIGRPMAERVPNVLEDPMTAPKKTDETPLETELEGPTPERIPAALRKVLRATPSDEWSKIRFFLVESEEEGELVELLPEMRRGMKTCMPKLVKRVRKREITAQELDRGYMQLHDAIHGVRQALYALLHLAGYRDYRIPKAPNAGEGPGGPAEEGGESEPESLAGLEERSEALAGPPGPGPGVVPEKPAVLVRSGKN
jgi:hypothetical protein